MTTRVIRVAAVVLFAGLAIVPSTALAGVVYSYTTIDDPLGVYGTSVNGINNLGQVVGTYWDANNIAHAFVESGGTYTTLIYPSTDGSYTLANGINDSGQVVGTYTDANFKSHGFVESGGTYTTIDHPLGVYGTSISGINNLGQVVGDYYYDCGLQ